MTAAPALLPHHAALIRASAISDAVARERGYRSITDSAELIPLGFADYQRRPGLLVPIHGPDGRRALHQLRPDAPREDRNKPGKAIKYETPAGARMRLDVPLRCRPHLSDPQIELWITEGVRKADSGVTNGLSCIVALLGVENWRGTNAQGGRTALGEWADVALPGRACVVAFDSDVMTKPAVRRALDELTAWLRARGARSVRYCLLPPGPNGEKTGLDDFFARGGTVDDARRCVVDTLPPAVPPAPPFPVAGLPGVCRAMVEAVSEAQDVDPSFAALPLLAAAGALIGGGVVLQLAPGWREPAILWTVVIAPASAGKTPAADAMIAPVALAERAALDAYRAQYEAYERNLEDWQGLGRNERANVAKPTRPTIARTLTDDPTLEALALLLHASPGVLYEAGEIGGWLAGFDRYRQGKGGDRARWLKLWQHHLWTPDRKTAQTVYVARPHVTLTGGIQPRRLDAFAKDLESGDGLFPRFLFAFPAPRIPDPTEGCIPADLAAAYAAHLGALRKEPPAPDPRALRAGDQHVVTLDPEAHERWQAWRWELNDRRRDPALLDSALGEYLGKLPAHAARLALVLHALADPHTYHQTPIAAPTLAAALDLAGYFAAHAQGILRHVRRDTSAPLAPDAGPVLSAQRRAILDALDVAPEPLSPQELAERTGMTSNAVRSLLHDMLRDGQVDRPARGVYRATRSNNGNNGNNEPDSTSGSAKGTTYPEQQPGNSDPPAATAPGPLLPDAPAVATPAPGQQQADSAPPSPETADVADVADVAAPEPVTPGQRRFITVEV